MSSSLANLDNIPFRQRKRKEIIMEFHSMRAKNPKFKKHWLMQEVARKLGYTLDKNKASSHVMSVIRSWENAKS